MLPCAFCERPLECDRCGLAYNPANPEDYLKLSRPEEPVACPGCGELLVCKWCKTPYDGDVATEDAD